MLKYCECDYHTQIWVIGASVSEPPLSAANGDFVGAYVRTYEWMVLYTANTSNTYFNGMPSLTLAPQCSAFSSSQVSYFLLIKEYISADFNSIPPGFQPVPRWQGHVEG